MAISTQTHCHNSCPHLEQRVGLRRRANGDLQAPENPDSLRGLGSIPSCWLWRGGQLRVSWSPPGARAALAGTGLGILRVLRARCQKLHASVEPATVLWQRKTWPAGSLPSVGGSDRLGCSLRASRFGKHPPNKCIELELSFEVTSPSSSSIRKTRGGVRGV